MANPKNLVELFWDRLGESPGLLLSLPYQPSLTEPMTAMFDDPFPSTLYFYTRTDNRLVEALAESGPLTTAHFVSREHDLFVNLAGTASRCGYSKMVDYFWSEDVAAQYEGGQADERLEMLRLNIEHAEMWQVHPRVPGRWNCVHSGSLDRGDATESVATVTFL